MSFHHTGTAELETGRLMLRRFISSDAESAHRNWAGSQAVQHGYGEPAYESPEAVRALLESWIDRYGDCSIYRWAIIVKGQGENIGQIAFCCVYTDIAAAEIEYCVGEAHWGCGYAAEALAAVLDYGFSVPEFSRLEAFHRQENPRSGRVMQKAGMRPADTVRRFELEGVKPHGEVCYQLTKEEYLQKTADRVLP